MGYSRAVPVGDEPVQRPVVARWGAPELDATLGPGHGPPADPMHTPNLLDTVGRCETSRLAEPSTARSQSGYLAGATERERGAT
jgi:hypothetical protein